MTRHPVLQDYQARLNALIDQTLPETPPYAPRLYQAMRHTALAGGKRLRPTLVYLTGAALGATLPALDAPALAVELMHCYSLIHDDLPAMDDDSLRRGQPACHIAFDEATAILAGDALQSLAFELLAEDSPHYEATQQLNMIATLAKASGATGMVAGQMLDLQAEQTHITLAELTQIHTLKTGQLLTASIQLGGFAAHCTDQTVFNTLTQVGEKVGLAFQIQDDLLDVTQSTQTLGKPQGADQTANKTTYLSFMTVEQAQQQSHQLLTQADQLLQQLPYATDDLRHFIDHLAHRDH